MKVSQYQINLKQQSKYMVKCMSGVYEWFQCRWLFSFLVFIDLGRFEERVQAQDVQSQQIRDMLDHELQKYVCVSCGNQYKKVGHLRRHLKDKHLWDFIENDTEEDKKPDRIAIYRASLMKCPLLLKDTNDGYSMDDGD